MTTDFVGRFFFIPLSLSLVHFSSSFSSPNLYSHISQFPAMSGNSPPPGPKRLPRNAAPIPFITSAEVLSTSPGSYQIEPPPSLGQSLDIPTRSPSGYSEIEVVLDDGTLQKRTVSLSTLPDAQPTDDEDDVAYESQSRDRPR